MAKQKKVNQEEKVSSAKILIQLYLSGKLTQWDLTKRLGREGMNYTKIDKNARLEFVIRGAGIERTVLTF